MEPRGSSSAARGETWPVCSRRLVAPAPGEIERGEGEAQKKRKELSLERHESRPEQISTYAQLS